MSDFNGSSLEARSEEDRASVLLPVPENASATLREEGDAVVRIYAIAAVIGAAVGLAVAVARFFMKRGTTEVFIADDV